MPTKVSTSYKRNSLKRLLFTKLSPPERKEMRLKGEPNKTATTASARVRRRRKKIQIAMTASNMLKAKRREVARDVAAAVDTVVEEADSMTKKVVTIMEEKAESPITAMTSQDLRLLRLPKFHSQLPRSLLFNQAANPPLTSRVGVRAFSDPSLYSTYANLSSIKH